MDQITLNGMHIIDDLNHIDLSKLEVGNQILILQRDNLTELNIDFNNVIIIFLIKKLYGCLYLFDGVNTDVCLSEEKLYESEYQKSKYSYELEGMYYEANDYESTYLLLNNNEKMEVHYAGEYEIDWNDPYDDDFAMFKKIANESNTVVNQFFNKSEKEYETYNFDILTVVPISDSYLCYRINNKITPSKYAWSKDSAIYIIDKEFTKYVTIECDELELFKKIKTLDCAQYNSQVNDLINIYIPAYRYDINDYLKNPVEIENVYTTFKNIPELSVDIINKYYYPIFIDDSIEFKAYFYSMSSYGKHIRYSCNRYKGTLAFNKPEKFANDIRKAEAVLTQLRKYSVIDIYTGEINDNERKYEKIYEDAGGFMIKECKDNRGQVLYYIKIDNIYVKATNEEGRSMIERQNMIKKMIE